MRRQLLFCASTCFIASAFGELAAQTQFIIADRTTDALFRVHDVNNNGIIENSEISLWFDAANTAGTPGPLNTTAQAISVCRVMIMGDQQNQHVLRLTDANNDGDAQDVGESQIFIGPGNSAGLSFAFPTGAAFDSNCIAYIVNAGNAFGPDAIYRLADLNGDGDAMDEVKGVHEATYYVGEPVFGAGNGPYSPQEIFFDANDVGYLRNSSANLHGIYKFVDLNNNGRADDAGEFTVFLNTNNASGVAVGAGFALEPDRFRMNTHTAMYTMQVATGGVDQIIRAIDLNHDGDAQDLGEAVLVWSNAASGFTGVDLVSRPNGDLLVTDNSANTVVLLRDLNNDGDFMDEGEMTVYLANSPQVLAAARQMDPLCRIGDTNCDGVVNANDLLIVINAWGPGMCVSADITCDGVINVNDLLAVINNWG